MKVSCPLIAVGFGNPIDRKLVTDYLSTLGYDIIELIETNIARADLFLLDVPSARRHGPAVLTQKKKSGIFLPAVVVLGKRDAADPWLEAGFDDVLRMPLSRSELRANLQILLRLRQRTLHLKQKGEIKYRAIFEATGTATLLVDEDTTILMANRQCLRLTGYNPQELIGTRGIDYIAPEDRDLVLSYHKARLEDPAKPPEQYEARLINKNGKVIHTLLSVSMMPGSKQSIVSMIDITAQKEAEAAHERLSAAIHHAAGAVIITDTEGNIEYVNPAFERVTGYSRNEALGKNPRILKSGQHDASFYKNLWETITSGRTWYGKFINRRKDGSLFIEEASISPIFDASGKITHYVAVKRDVTREEELEQQLLQAQKMEAIGRLAGGVAHDFNNMLSVILGYSDIILRQLRPEDPLADKVKQIVEAGKRSAALTRQLLAFSRQQTLQPKALDLNVLIRNLEKMLGRLIGENIDLKLELADDLYRVMADPGQIEQVIMNLVVNARDAMPDGGKITIETANVELDELYARNHMGVSPGKYVMLAISDTGHGMDKDTLSKIFDPFFTTKEKGKGTGLGLSTVYGIVKQSGGNILVYSEPEKGTTFKIYLPETKAQPHEEKEEEAPIESSAGEHILVVEDEEALRNLAGEILKRLGYRVTVAANGGEALLLIEKKGLKPDLLITDVIMPNMSGKELVEILRENHPHLKVLYMSGYTDNAIVHHGVLDAGVHFIQKPFTINDFASKVQQVLQNKKPS